MKIRTIAVALVVAAPFLALESPQAAAFDCWTTGHGYTAATATTTTTTTTTVAPRRRYGYLGYRGVGWRRGYGYGVGRVGRWR